MEGGEEGRGGMDDGRRRTPTDTTTIAMPCLLYQAHVGSLAASLHSIYRSPTTRARAWPFSLDRRRNGDRVDDDRTDRRTDGRTDGRTTDRPSRPNTFAPNFLLTDRQLRWPKSRRRRRVPGTGAVRPDCLSVCIYPRARHAGPSNNSACLASIDVGMGT